MSHAPGEGNVIACRDHDPLPTGQLCHLVQMGAQAHINSGLSHDNLMRPLICGGHFTHDLKGPVGRRIIREDDLQGGIILGKGPLDSLTDILLLSVTKNREGYQGMGDLHRGKYTMPVMVGTFH